MSHYSEPKRSIADKVTGVIDLSNQVTKKELKDATVIDTSNVASKKDFIFFKAEVDQLVINKLVNISTDLNDLKTKADGSDVDKLETVPVDLKKFSDVVSKEVFNKLNAKLHDLENKIPDAPTLIHIIQHKTDKQDLEKKPTAILNAKIPEVEKKIPDVHCLVKKTDLTAKISNIEWKYFTTSGYDKFLSEILDTKLKQAILVTNNDLNTVSEPANKNKAAIRKLKTFDLSKNYFLIKIVWRW